MARSVPQRPYTPGVSSSDLEHTPEGYAIQAVAATRNREAMRSRDSSTRSSPRVIDVRPGPLDGTEALESWPRGRLVRSRGDFVKTRQHRLKPRTRCRYASPRLPRASIACSRGTATGTCSSRAAGSRCSMRRRRARRGGHGRRARHAVGQEMRHIDDVPGVREVRQVRPTAQTRKSRQSPRSPVAGVEIPLGSRIITVCDSFDAMISDRPYASSRTIADALTELRRCAGTQFDPDIVAVFTQVLADRAKRPSASTTA
jgi:hypothetical protein